MSSNNRLKKLTSAALLLLADDLTVNAAALDKTPKASVRLSNYTEAEIDATERYDIDIQQFRLYKPINDQHAITVNVVYETMAGASPWYVIPDVNGKPIQIMSGATIEEKRQDVSVSGTKQTEQTTLSASIGNSSENDYDATYAGLSIEKELDDKSLSIFAGLTLSNDDITPTPSATETRVSKETKNSRSLYAGISKVINKNMLFSSSLSYTRVNGFLSDPYKQAYTLDNNGAVQIINDSRPDTKTQMAWSAKLRYHLGNNISLHGDYRYFRDSWEISSHTISSTIFKTIAVNWRISQELRYYNQSRAYFYAPFYNGTRSDGYHSSDYRLSPFGAISARFKLNYAFDSTDVNFAIEKYTSSGDLALKEVTIENPALVEFMVISIGVDVKFD